MKDEMSDTQALPPETREQRDAHAAPLLPETPSILPGASPPVVRAVRRGRMPRWLLATLVGILVLAGGIGLLISLLQRPANPATTSSAFPAPDPVVDLQGGPGTQLLATIGPILTPTNLSNLQKRFLATRSHHILQKVFDPKA